MESAYFLTVDWCKQGNRGVFCSGDGSAFRSEEEHTMAEMQAILGPFWLVLNPQSQLFTENELAAYNQYRPLDEYSGAYGIASPE
jgi:hypothetical protein